MTQPEAYTSFTTRTESTAAENELWDLVNNEKLLEGEVDVIIWGEGDDYDRVPKVLELYRRYGGDIPVLLSGGLEGNPYRPDQETSPTGGNIHSRDMKQVFLSQGIPENNILLEDQSRNAHEQAVNVVKIIQEKGWTRIVLVASPWHQPRLFLTFLAELKKAGLDKKVEIINQPVRLNPLRNVPGRNKDYTELIPEELNRITQYGAKGDVASPADGLVYLRQFLNKKFVAVSQK